MAAVNLALEQMDDAIAALDLPEGDPLRHGLEAVAGVVKAVDATIAGLSDEQQRTLLALKAGQKQFARDVATDVLSVIDRDIELRLSLYRARLWLWISLASLGGLLAGVGLGVRLAFNLH